MPDPNALITQLDLSVRTYYCLHRAGLFTVAMIVEKTPEELLKIGNFGRRSLEELRETLVRAGYNDPWPELDGPPEAASSLPLQRLGLRPDIEAALVAARRTTLARLLGTPGDDLLDFLSWEQYQELRRRLVALGHVEPGNIERSE